MNLVGGPETNRLDFETDPALRVDTGSMTLTTTQTDISQTFQSAEN